MVFVANSDGEHVALQENEAIEPTDRIAPHHFPSPELSLKDYLLIPLVLLSLPLQWAVYGWERIKVRKRLKTFRKTAKYIEKASEYTSQNSSVPFAVGEDVLVISQRGHLYKWKYPFGSAKVTKVDGDEVTVSYQVNLGGIKGSSSKNFFLHPEPNPGRMYFSHEITPESKTIPEMLLRRPPMESGDRWTLFA
jgi:hypothetical protein